MPARRMSHAEAWRRMQAGGVTVLDIRTPEEYAEEHLPGAVSLPAEQLGRAPALLPGDRPVLVYCRGGQRAGWAAGRLARMGFDACDIGGILAWPYAVEP